MAGHPYNSAALLHRMRWFASPQAVTHPGANYLISYQMGS